MMVISCIRMHYTNVRRISEHRFVFFFVHFFWRFFIRHCSFRKQRKRKQEQQNKQQQQHQQKWKFEFLRIFSFNYAKIFSYIIKCCVLKVAHTHIQLTYNAHLKNRSFVRSLKIDRWFARSLVRAFDHSFHSFIHTSFIINWIKQ